MLDFTINIPTLFMFGGAILSFVVWLVRMEGRVAAAEATAATASDDAKNVGLRLEATHGMAVIHKEEFYEYQVRAAKEFVTQSTVAETKRDMLEGITRMENRLETQVNRLVQSLTEPKPRRKSGDTPQ